MLEGGRPLAGAPLEAVALSLPAVGHSWSEDRPSTGTFCDFHPSCLSREANESPERSKVQQKGLWATKKKNGSGGLSLEGLSHCLPAS